MRLLLRPTLKVLWYAPDRSSIINGYSTPIPSEGLMSSVNDFGHFVSKKFMNNKLFKDAQLECDFSLKLKLKYQRWSINGEVDRFQWSMNCCITFRPIIDRFLAVGPQYSAAGNFPAYVTADESCIPQQTNQGDRDLQCVHLVRRCQRLYLVYLTRVSGLTTSASVMLVLTDDVKDELWIL